MKMKIIGIYTFAINSLIDQVKHNIFMVISVTSRLKEFLVLYLMQFLCTFRRSRAVL